ncbi:MAG: PQQ-binding-like beta-propeller repeat protein [Phycisphaerales bacterium]|nr:PQQ-binding-like beta-propeller repeat protein [Phycisphaerales bacterium]
MDVPHLIGLLQIHRLEDLCDEHIAEIRDRLESSFELREALEAALPEDTSETPESFKETIAVLQSLNEAKPKRRIKLIAAIAFVAIAAIIAFIANRPNTTEPTPPKPATTQPATSPTTKPTPTTRPKKIEPVDPIKQVTGTPMTQPSEIAILPATFPMKWDDYALAGTGYESDWRKHIPTLLRPEKGARTPKLSNDRKYVELNGSYRLGALPARGRLLRLAVRQGKRCDLEFWNANNKVLITIDRNKALITMTSIARKDFKSPPKVIDSADDHYRWQSRKCYGVDIRHQDGRMMVCLGEVPMLSVAMAKPPTQGKLDCSSLSLYIAESRVVGPLALPANKVIQPSITKTNAAEFKWTLDPGDKKPEEVELAIDKNVGKVTLISKIDHIHARAGMDLPVSDLAGVELTVHVTQFHPSTVIVTRSAMGNADFRFEPHDDGYIIYTGNRTQKAAAIARGEIVGKEFWVKIHAAGDSWGMWISPDSKRWWRKISQQNANKMDNLMFGFELPTAKVKNKGPRQTTIGDITVRKFDAFAKLADPKLVEQTAKALDKKLLGTYSKPAILAALSKSTGQDESNRQWAMAYNTILAASAMHWRSRCEAMGDLFDDAIAVSSPADTPKILSAIIELSELCWQNSDMGIVQQKAFETLARHCMETGNQQAVEHILNASYLSPAGRIRPMVIAPELLRLHLQNLIANGDWKAVRREAMRALYHAGSTNSWEDRHILPFTLWAISEANLHLANKAAGQPAASSTGWRHTLVVNDDREMINMLGEFLFLVKNKNYQEACKVITGKTLSDDLISLGDEDNLLQSSHFRVREVIRTTPQLREVLNRDYSEIGMIRLSRATRQNDLNALTSLAVQFYGTEPGFGAIHVLADRDLSNGNFWSAADRYQLLSNEQGYKKRYEASAKLRLAAAMRGQLVGKPADKPVELSGGTFSAQEFEQMVTRMAAARKPKPSTAASKVQLGPEPRGKTAKVTYLAKVPGEKTNPHHAVGRRATFAADNERLIISLADKVCAIDSNSRKIARFHQPDRKQRDRRKRKRDGKYVISLAARPLRIGDKLFIRYATPGHPLTCIDIKTGKLLWSKQYDDYTLSDPISTGAWVSVITASTDTTSAALQLHRVSPETGESSLATRLVRSRDLLPTVGRPVIVGDSILFRAEGCLINCSLRGTVRWAKRLPFVPRKALPDLHEDIAMDDMIVQNENVIFSLPGCPYIMCVSAKTGETIWSFMTKSSVQILGLHAKHVIVAEPDRICGLDPDTGQPRWSRRHNEKIASVFPAAKDTLIRVVLDRPLNSKDTSPSRRYVQWISAKDGTAIKKILITGDSSLYNPIQIYSNGKRIFGLAAEKPSDQDLPKIFMIEIGN